MAGNLDFDLDDPMVGALIDRADRFLAGHRNPLVQSFAGILGQVLAGRAPSAVPLETDAPRARARAADSSPPRPPPPPAPVESPLDVLGFGPSVKLTRALVKERQRELAKLFHPDRQGSTKALQRINGAAQALLRDLK
jgi:hypothetical protein